MKIAFLSPASSVHTVRWANGLFESGHEVHLISQHSLSDGLHAGVRTHIFPYRGVLGYFAMVDHVRKLLSKIQPDIVNAHYASGYGTVARMVKHHPWIISVWGSDIYDFPNKSPLHKWLIKSNLLAADGVASTSNCMANETRKISSDLTNIAITPFGVDMAAYNDCKPEPAVQKKKLVIGTVKAMRPIYGINTLIEAFALLQKSLRNRKELEVSEIELRLVGGGEQTSELRALAVRLGIADKVNFVGRVPHTQVPQELAKLDIYVALSRQESFGVAIIEAGAAGRPVVVSDAGGLPEVAVDGVTGFVVARENPAAAAAAMERLVLDAKLRNQMGQAGQAHVAHHYSWDACVKTMLGVYEEAIQRHSLQKA